MCSVLHLTCAVNLSIFLLNYLPKDSSKGLSIVVFEFYSLLSVYLKEMFSFFFCYANYEILLLNLAICYSAFLEYLEGSAEIGTYFFKLRQLFERS